MNTPLPIWFQESMVSMATRRNILVVGLVCNDVPFSDSNPSVTLLYGAKRVSLELKVGSVAGCVSHHSGGDCCSWSACLPRHVRSHYCPASVCFAGAKSTHSMHNADLLCYQPNEACVAQHLCGMHGGRGSSSFQMQLPSQESLQTSNFARVSSKVAIEIVDREAGT